MKNKFALLSCFLLLMAISFKSIAQKEPVYLDMLMGDSVYTGNSLTVKDSVFFDVSLKPTIKHTYFINNLISLRINENINKVMPDSFGLDVKVRVLYDTSGFTGDTIPEKILHIDFNKFHKTYQDKSVFLFHSAHYVKLEILEISSTFADTTVVKPLVLLENRMVIERDYLVDCTNDAIDTIHLDTATIATTGELKISWTPNLVSQMYDVEWTFLDQSAIDNGRYDNIYGNIDPKLVFKNNATRVTTKADTCMIPLLFDGEGRIFYRVRGAQIDQYGEMQTTRWSSEEDTLAANWNYHFYGHERDLNWQASTTFAEEAKRKSVVQYFDGSLRARQVVTRDNTTLTTVVAETLYDKQGRPAIQVLPASTLNTIIGYTPLFNVRDMNSAEYDKGVYDTLFTSTDYCAAEADSFSAVSGAAHYYSELNELSTIGFHRFIARDSGFTFTQTQYTQDNTGRIYRQSGVGSKFKLGSGKETKYFYGRPDQTDLDALFGTEVGDASHYQKNMVRDPNGQYSVSYVDMHGRTIATALAGAAPGSLDTIKSYRRDSLQTEDLLTQTNNLVNGNALEFSQTIFMTKTDSVWIHYNMGTQGLTLKDCNDNNICYSCLYDLTISVVAECGNGVGDSASKTVKLSNFPLWQVDTACGLAIPLDVTIPLRLKEGSFTINKKLEISKEGMDKYRDSVYLILNMCKTYQDIYAEQMEIIKDSIDCSNDTLNRPMYLSYREQMMADLHPLTGQYADTASNRSCFSIFNKTMSFGVRRWYQVVADTGFYRNEEGQLDSVLNSQGELVPPQKLTVNEFISNYKDSWALNLLSLHPEYCYLKKFESLADSHIWDEDFEKTETYLDAKTKGYLNPTGNSSNAPASNFPINHTDPLYGYSGFGATAKDRIQDSLFHFRNISPAPDLTVWGLATAIGKGGDTLSKEGLIKWNTTAYAFHSDSLCAGELDMAWRIFRGIYLEQKRQWVDKYIRTQCASSQYPHAPCQPVFPKRDSVLIAAGYSPYGGSHDSTVGEHLIDSFATANCASYVDTWKEQLGDCYSTEQKDAIIASLLNVCKEGSDKTHPYGSSTVKPSSSATLRSFDDVIKYYNTLWNITNQTCNAYRIDKPFPYDKQKSIIQQQIWNKPDSCSCHKIDSLYSVYNGHYLESFGFYLREVEHLDITDGVADSLRRLCSGLIQCKFLSQPITLPTKLQCGNPLSNCIDCYAFNLAYDSFKVKFPTITPTLGETDTVQHIKNIIFENYMNHWFGFHNKWYDYVNFQTYCSNHGVIRPTCDSLTKYWWQYYSVSHPENTDCQGFVSYFNGKIGTEFTKVQIDSIYSGCGITINWCDTIPYSPSQITILNDKLNCLINSYTNPAVLDTGACGISPWEILTLDNGSGVVINSRPAIDSLIENGVMRNIRRPGDSLNGVRFYRKYGRRGFKVRDEFAYEFRIRNNYGSPTDPVIPDSLYIGYDDLGINQPGSPYDEQWVVLLSNYNSGGHLRNGRNNFVFFDSALNNIDFYNWHTYKFRQTHDSVEFYFDGNRLIQLPRDGTSYTYQAGGWRTGFNHARSDSFKIDWLKVWGSADSLIYFEDFNASPSLFTAYTDTNYYTPLPDCQTLRKNLFNSLTGKNWTTIQVNYYLYGSAIYGCEGLMDPTLMLCDNGNDSLDVDLSTCGDSVNTATTAAMQLYQIYKDSLINHFNDAYTKKCLNTGSMESLTITKPVSEYHYTLYYYDLAGNLVKTVPPEGVHPNRSQVFLDSVKVRRAKGLDTLPIHNLVTTYRYNSLNQVVSQKTPDGGLSKFWYDRLGRLVVSQNAKQSHEYNYSYTKYDVIGRIVEVGQKKNDGESMNQSISREASSLKSWLDYNLGDFDFQCKQVTVTHYDEISDQLATYESFTPFRQKAYTLRNRVSWTRYYDNLNVGSGPDYAPLYFWYNTGIEYSYDIHGNVDSLLNLAFVGTLMENFAANRFKYIAYKYDLISGKVNEVHYQAGFADEFYHRYEYDADNRLTDVYTTDNKAYLYQTGLEEHDAHYEYYKHGPLARMVIGQQQVQGIDYAYTLQGWLKGVNSTSLNPDFDMGMDGKSGGAHWFVGRDVYSFNLNYFINDYQSIDPTVNIFPGHYAFLSSGEHRPLYNGNISSMAVNIGKFNQPQLYNYHYDQLNRLTGMDTYSGLDSTNNLWSGLASTDDYLERVAYDGNGNIKEYKRTGFGATKSMDELLYTYKANTNQLVHVSDGVSSGNYSEDFDDMGHHDFVYDEIGNLIRDTANNIGNIDWNVYGKISNIGRLLTGANQVSAIEYKYDPSGNRVGKKVYMYSSPDYNAKYTWYVRDAQGNVMAVYESTVDDSWTYTTLRLKEHHVYGSSRLGIIERDFDMDSLKSDPVAEDLIGNTYLYDSYRGEKRYELSNHLGNVLVTISDKKFGIDEGSDGQYDFYNADVVNATDYYPFGMMMPGRSYSAESGYRYGFNGKENDNEVKGEGNQQDYGMRIYDPRIGKFLSVDPLCRNYPFFSPYQFAGNTPIQAIDIDGLEPSTVTVKDIYYYYKDAHIVIKADIEIKAQIVNLSSHANNELDLNGIGDVVRGKFGTQLQGTHTGEYPSNYKLNKDSKNPELASLFNQKYEFEIDKVTVRTEVVNSTKELDNDAFALAVVDNIRPMIGSDGKPIDPVGLTNTVDGIVLLEAQIVTTGKTNTEESQNRILHEMGHGFGEDHNPSSTDVMNKYASKSLNFSEKQIANMIKYLVGNWDKVWREKETGKDLLIETKRTGNSNEKVEDFAEEHN